MRLDLDATSPADYLAGDGIIETTHPDVIALAASLRAEHLDDRDFARAAFEWVRDEVAHAWDAQDRRTTVSASDALRERVGLCFVKSHLLAALLRAQGVPAGLCYQRLGNPTDGHYLHGLVAIYLDGAWHRQDPRGNTQNVDAQFSLAEERLAWLPDTNAGQVDYSRVYSATVPVVLEALQAAQDSLVLCAGGLPDRIGD